MVSNIKALNDVIIHTLRINLSNFCALTLIYIPLSFLFIQILTNAQVDPMAATVLRPAKIPMDLTIVAVLSDILDLERSVIKV